MVLVRLHFLLYCICNSSYNQFLFSFLHFILCRMCVCHMFNKVLTYLLTYLGRRCVRKLVDNFLHRIFSKTKHQVIWKAAKSLLLQPQLCLAEAKEVLISAATVLCPYAPGTISHRLSPYLFILAFRSKPQF